MRVQKETKKLLTGIMVARGPEVGLVVVDEEFIIYAELRKADGTILKGKEAMREILRNNYYATDFEIERDAITPNTLLMIPEILEDDYVVFDG